MLGAHRRCEGNTVVSESRLDSVARWLAGAESRRAVIRAGAGLALGGLIPARMPELAGAAPPPVPAASNDNWPICSDPDQHYCVETFTADGVDLLTDATRYQWMFVADRDVVSPGPATRMGWDVIGDRDRMTVADAETKFRFVVRCGRLEPTATFMRATRGVLRKTGDAANGWRLEIVGQPSVTPGGDNPLGTGQATGLMTDFSGSSLHRKAATLSMWEGFEGFISVSGAASYSPPYRRGDGWYVGLRGYHLWPDGVTLNQGSYQAWVSPQSLQTLGLTVEQAVAGGLTVARIDDGVESSIRATLAADAGGVLIEIPDLTFSSPTIAIRKAGKRGCATKCRKGRVCRNGHCKKKQKRGKH